jgi:hypothetical protein
MNCGLKAFSYSCAVLCAVLQVIAINSADPKAANVNSLEDVER